MPAWRENLLQRVNAPAEDDDDVRLLLHLNCGQRLHALANDPDVLLSLSQIYRDMELVRLPDADARMTGFLLTACMGHERALRRFKLPPSQRAPDLKRLATNSRKLAKVIIREAKSFLPNTDRLSYLLKRGENPSTYSASTLMGLRAASFNLKITQAPNQLPTLQDTLLWFAEALEEQAELIKSEVREQQHPLGNFIDRLIKTSHELFPGIHLALIAKVASVVSGEDVEPSRVQKRVKKLKKDGRL